MEQQDLTVCIVNWNVRVELARCLESIFSDPGSARWRVIVVDNASTDDSVAMVRERFPRVELIVNRENRGFAAACNQALALSAAPYALLLNPDTIVPPGALPALLRVADENRHTCVVAPKLLNSDGSLQYSCRHFPTIAAAIFRNTILSRLVPMPASVRAYLLSDWRHDSMREVDWVSGACMLIRADCLAEVGMLDEELFWGSEDVDFCWRAHKAGWSVLYTPEPQVVHAIGRSTDQAVLPTIWRRHRSMYRLYRKHLAHDPIRRVLVWLGVWIRAGLLAASWLVKRRLRRV